VEAALAGRVRGVLDVALHRFLGITLVDPDDPARGITLVVGDEAVNNTDVLHGGIVTALLDVACYLTLLPQLTPEENALTHDVTASLIRPVPRDAHLQIQASVIRRGRTLVFLRAEATVGDSVVAVAQVTKTLIRSGI